MFVNCNTIVTDLHLSNLFVSGNVLSRNVCRTVSSNGCGFLLCRSCSLKFSSDCNKKNLMESVYLGYHCVYDMVHIC
jgi:hypothetical protein